jgi:glucokinase
VDPGAGAEGIRRQIVQALPQLLSRANIDRNELRGLGVGFGGPVDDATASVIKSHQIEGWADFPLAQWLDELLGMPVVVGNDADVAALAEATFGAGQGRSPVFYITVGSGIGGGLIIDGKIHRGVGRGAAEVGHLGVPVRDGDGMRYVPLEELASGWAIQARARQEAARSKEAVAFWCGVQGNGAELTAEDVASAAAAGHEPARRILDSAWAHLAQAICQVIALVCPERIVVGGGVSLMGEQLLFGPLRKLVAERVFAPFRDCYDIVPAALGETVVVHGALALARQRLGE